MTATETTTTTTGSAVVAALEDVWAAMQDRVADLPDVVFITGTGLMGRGAKWGHYRGHGWAVRGAAVEHTEDGALVIFDEAGRKPEVFVAGERLASGAANTLQTVLHEGAHALAEVREERDTSKEGRYHNRTFLALATELGLAFEGDPSPTIGYSAVVLTDEAREDYAEVIERLDAAIALYLDTFAGLRLGGDSDGGGEAGGKTLLPRSKAKSRNNPKLVCGCGRIIRASKSVLAEGPIVCGLCGDEFAPEE